MAPVKRGNRSPSPRTHIVLVPGFAGFDALGQMDYYAGVTPIFCQWQSKYPSAVLHYFDNFPTAAVKTRAQRLRDYLAKRIARGEFLDGDPIALVEGVISGYRHGFSRLQGGAAVCGSNRNGREPRVA